MEKYELLPEQLLYEGTITQDAFFAPESLSEDIILRTHSKEFWDKLRSNTLSRKEVRAIGFPMRPELIARGRVIAGGTLEGARTAMNRTGIALNVAGGTHHSFRDRGEGFCVFNDIAIATNELLYNGEIRRAMIVDLDVHQGNGTAAIFAEEDRVFTFSMHGAKNYPHRKPPSDLDIGLADKTSDAEYLATLSATLPRLLDEFQPDLVFYLSGVDIIESDKLGRLSVSIAGCKARDRFVFECCRSRKLPVMVAMGGGYSKQLAHIIEAHANTFRLAVELWA
ncbi:histone deacetylase [Lewinellaceae bacterium SD302]|nr:histone deacetylase [Lewinellaceae bacterium SD302]